jgi:hypothetical protein
MPLSAFDLEMAMENWDATPTGYNHPPATILGQ